VRTHAALPTSGSRMRATNSRLIFPDAVKPSILLTSHSATNPVRTVMPTKRARANWTLSLGVSCSSSLSSLLEDELLLDEEELE
jgi:hypothetical protein